MLEHGLTIDIELPARRLQALDALVEFGKQFLDLGNDAVLFGWQRAGGLDSRPSREALVTPY